MWRKFLFRGFLFCIPLYVWCAAVLCIDPFNYFRLGGLIPTEVKEGSVRPLNILMYSVLEQSRNPCENLIIGDSRIFALSTDLIERWTGERYLQLGSNALKLNEAMELFWLANRIRKPKRVFFGLNFNMYNKYAFADRVKGMETVLRNPFVYLFDRSVAASSYKVLKTYASGSGETDWKPPMTKEEFWGYILEARSLEHFGKYGYPQEYFEGFGRIVEHAKRNGIEVVMIIVPHHVEFQKKVHEYKLGKEYLRFKKDLVRLGVKVFDYDFENELTSDKNRFTDPIHCDEVFGEIIVREVWGHAPLRAGRLLSPGPGEEFKPQGRVLVSY
jgi:hypothetical protein